MENFDFDQFLRNNMQSVPAAADGLAEDWQKLSGRLEDFDRKRLRSALLPWAGALLFLLLLSNLGWWMAWRSGTKEIAELRGSLKNISSDTIIGRPEGNRLSGKTIHIYDTVYHTTTIINRENNIKTFGDSFFRRPGSQFENNNSGGISGDFHQGSPAAGISGAVISRELMPVDSAMAEQNTGPNDVIAAPVNVTPVPSLPLTAGLPEKPLRFPAQPLLITPQITKKAPVSYFLRHTALGLYGGLMHARSNNIAISSGTTAGLAGEAPLSDNWSCTFNAGYGGVSMKGYVYDQHLGLPPLNPPGSEFKFKYFETHEGRKPVFDLGLGLRLYPWKHGTWRPFIGANYTAQWQLPYELEIEYFNPDTGVEISEEAEMPFDPAPVSMLGLNAGIIHSLSSHINLQVSGFYHIKVRKERFAIPYYRGLSAGIFYAL